MLYEVITDHQENDRPVRNSEEDPRPYPVRTEEVRHPHQGEGAEQGRRRR